MRSKTREILTGVEIGTGTIKVVMGEPLPDDAISIIGTGEIPSLKVVKGEIIDTHVVQEQLERALAMAEQESGEEIGDIFLAATGGHMHTVNSVGTTMVGGSDGKITADDVVAAARNAHAYSLPPDKKVLHYFDRFYRMDESREVTNPIGLVASRLEADVHIIYGQHNRLETNCTMITDAMGYPATDMAFSAVAAAMGAFTPEDIEKGCLLIDIGAGVSEYAVFHGPGCFHSGQLTVGCDHLANDLAVGLHLPLPKCRKILHDLADFGSVVMTPDGRARLISVDTLGQATRRIPVSTVEQILDLRLREFFDAIWQDLRSHGALERIGAGIRLAGGGAMIAGIDRLVRDLCHMPASVAKPRLVSGKQDVLTHPRFLTPIGLIRWGKLMLDIGPGQSTPLWQQLRLDTHKVLHLLRKSFRW